MFAIVLLVDARLHSIQLVFGVFFCQLSKTSYADNITNSYGRMWPA
jgi:hypothetical protein